MNKSHFPSGGFLHPVRTVVSRVVDDSGDVREILEVLDCGHKVRNPGNVRPSRRCVRCPPVLGKLYDPDALKSRRAYERDRRSRRRAARRA